MGKLLFVNTNRFNGIAYVSLCLAFAGIGVWLTLDHTYVGIIFIPLGLWGAKFFLKMATQRAEFYEQGFVSKSIYGELNGRYADLKSIMRQAVRTNGVLTTNFFFKTQSGQQLMVSNEKFLKGDDKMALLLEKASTAMAETWMKTLERQTEVVWLTDGAKPLIKIRKDGVLVVDKSGSETWIPLNQFNVKPGYGLDVQICNVDQKILKVSAGAINYYPGQALIFLLANKQQSKAASTTS